MRNQKTGQRLKADLDSLIVTHSKFSGLWHIQDYVT